MTMTILLTGAAGFIGSHLAREAIARGDRIIGIDSFDRFYDRGLKERNIEDLRESTQFTLHETDIRDIAAMSQITRDTKPDLIIHLAALAGVRPSIEEPQRYADVNVNGTVSMLEAARDASCGSVLFASSSSVYGNRPSDERAFRETDDVDSPFSPYAATKRAGELICRTYAELFKLSIGSLRFFTVYGPRQRPDLAIAKFMRLIREEKPIPMFGDGATARDYTYIDDIVAGVLAAAAHVRDANAGFYRIWNIGGSSPVELRELIEAIGDIAGVTPRIEQHPMQPGDVVRTYADLSRITADLAWSPQTPLREGLERQWAAG